MKSFKEALKGDQHKLDKNKNGKLDAQDFKLLRKEEEQTPPFDGGAVKKSAKNSDGTTQSPMSRARELAKQAMKKKMKEEFDIDMSDEQVDSILQRMDEEVDEMFADQGSGSTRLSSRGEKKISNIVRKALAKNSETPDQIAARKDFQAQTDARMRQKKKEQGMKEEVELDESHFKLGDKVKCKSSGMVGKVVKLDEPDGPDDKEYYTVKHENGKTMKHAPNDLTMVKEALQPGWMLKADPKLGAKVKAKVDLAKKRQATYGDKSAGKSLKEEVDLIDEAADTGLAAKAKKSGISIGTLRKVYKRGVAAWNSGHRPGTTPQQWGMARVNSYITKGKGTYGGADKDLREEDEIMSEAKDKASGLPKQYVAGVSKSTAKARASHFEKTGKMSDSDPRAYEPAPGDATAKTKESKHTKKYREMFGEDMDEEIYEACWDSHKQVGMKKKGDRMVPDCRPKNEEATGKEEKVKKMKEETVNPMDSYLAALQGNSDFRSTVKEARTIKDIAAAAETRAGSVSKPKDKPMKPMSQVQKMAADAEKRKMKEEADTEKMSFTDFLKEYEAKSGVYRHKGSYGSSYQGDDDEDAPKKKPAEPAVKRGRGRPAGSKSGASGPRIK